MIDSIHIRVSKQLVNEASLRRLTNLVDIHTKQNNINGESLFGSYRNMNIAINPNTITINGSLPKFVHGHNVHTLNIDETKAALYRLKDDLQVPIFRGDLQRVDLAECFILNGDNLVPHFHSLLPTPNYERIASAKLSQGVRYVNKITLAFYNKTLEAIGVPEAAVKTNQQVMRIELRIMKNVRRTVINSAKKFGALFLLSPSFHKRLARLWLQHYTNVVKRRFILEHCELLGPKEYFAFLLAAYINHVGLEDAYSSLDFIAGENKWENRTLSYVKKKLRLLANSSIMTKENKYMWELEEQVQQGYIYALATNTP